MDWNMFFEELKKAGVVEVSLRFSETKTTTEKVVVENNQKEITQHVETPVEEKTEEKTQAVLDFQKSNPTWFTALDFSKACDMDKIHIYKLLKAYGTPFQKIGKTFVYDGELFALSRFEFEDDIIKHDGDRRGNVKFIYPALEKLLQK